MSTNDPIILGWIPALRAGVSDSLGPGGMTAFVLFIIFLFFCVRRNDQLVPRGVCFFAGFFAGVVCLSLTWLDWLISSERFVVALKVIYAVMIVAGFAGGGLLLRDWMIWRRTRDFGKLLVQFSAFGEPWGTPTIENSSIGIRSFFAFFRLGGVAIWPGILSALLISLWPQNEFLTFIFYTFTLPGQEPAAFFLLSLYCATLVWFLVMALVMFYSLMKPNSGVAELRKFLSRVQIAVSALLISYGCAMIIISIKFF